MPEQGADDAVRRAGAARSHRFDYAHDGEVDSRGGCKGEIADNLINGKIQVIYPGKSGTGFFRISESLSDIGTIAAASFSGIPSESARLGEGWASMAIVVCPERASDHAIPLATSVLPTPPLPATVIFIGRLPIQ